MNLVIDGRALVGNRTGIGVHTAEIAARLPFDPPPLVATHAPVEDRSGIERLRWRVDRAPLGVAWQQLRLPRVLREEGAEVLWGPHGTLPLTDRVPGVVTLHDFTSITQPHRHEMKTVASFNVFIGRSLARAAGIAAVSRTTAEQAARGFGVPLGRIEIVPNGIAPHFTPDGGAASDLPAGLRPAEYVLFTGTLEPRKGVDDLIAAWEDLRPRPKLVLCGDRGWGLGAVRTRIARLERAGDLVVTGFVGATVLAALYRNALLLAYPSRWEGFGLPPLEAMACGTPVVATRAGAIPEVTGDAALLVARGDVAELRSAMARVIASTALRDEMRARGLQRAKLFSWERSAALMADLIRRAARF